MAPPPIKRRVLKTSNALTYDDHGASDVYGSSVLAALQKEVSSSRTSGTVRRRGRGGGETSRLAENCRVYGIRLSASSLTSRGSANTPKRPGRGGRGAGSGDRSGSRQSRLSVQVSGTILSTPIEESGDGSESIRSAIG